MKYDFFFANIFDFALRCVHFQFCNDFITLFLNEFGSENGNKYVDDEY